MPGGVKEIYKLSIARLATEQYDRTILFPARKVSFHRSRKTLTQHCLSLFPLF